MLPSTARQLHQHGYLGLTVTAAAARPFGADILRHRVHYPNPAILAVLAVHRVRSNVLISSFNDFRLHL
jgi:hypothetical protein